MKKMCIIHANCQGDSLYFLLSATPAFTQKFTIVKYTNHLQESIDKNTLKKCELFLYQHLDEQWEELASKRILEQISGHAQSLRIPNMFFNGYWPLWTNKTTMAYGDILLEELYERGLSFHEILHLYTRGNLETKLDLDALRLISRQKEEAKEEGLLFPTLPLIENLWREEQLFYTVNHPAPRLSLYVADNVLQFLGLGTVPDSIRRLFSAHKEEFIQPIHPQVGQKYNLPFVTPERLYPVYGQDMTFQQYVAAYVNCRLQSGPDAITDFIVYLHLLTERSKKHG